MLYAVLWCYGVVVLYAVLWCCTRCCGVVRGVVVLYAVLWCCTRCCGVVRGVVVLYACCGIVNYNTACMHALISGLILWHVPSLSNAHLCIIDASSSSGKFHRRLSGIKKLLPHWSLCGGAEVGEVAWRNHCSKDCAGVEQC